MLVTNKKNAETEKYLDFVISCIEAGVNAVQLREKQMNHAELLMFGQALRSLLQATKTPLIINDNITLAIELNADGVHLGQQDESVIEARKQLGNDKIIGLSVDTMEQLTTANNLPLDYIGIGAIFPTKNKANINTVWGSEALTQLSKLSLHPILAIGGINEHNAKQVIQAGAHGIAAIDAFHAAKNIHETTKKLLKIIKGDAL